ncbi:MAG: glycosyl hydrolase [Verrucomicrobiota bacterium]
MSYHKKYWLGAELLLLCVARLLAADSLVEGFVAPPKESRPETWFHLIGGNVSKPGLTADLEAIQGAGLAGIQLFHGSSRGPAWPEVNPQIPCLSPAWDDMISHAANECGRLGLRFTMQNCPGWSQSGGPWIKPEESMRHLVWSRLDVTGGKSISTNLAMPGKTREEWRNYQEVAVIAFPTPAGDDGQSLIPMVVCSNRKELAWADLFAAKKGASVKIAAAGEPAWVELTFDRPVTLRSLELPPVEKFTLRRNFDPGVTIRIQALSNTGLVEVARREIPRSNWQDDQPLTLALPETTAPGFRITFENKTPLDFSFLRLSSAARMDDWEGQAGFVLRSLDRSFLPKQDRVAWVSARRILDLTGKMEASGKLNWQAPAGSWTVLRFGHVNTGAKNGPAPPEATGFECDKLSAKGADASFAGYIGRISASGGPADGGRLQGMVIDSWECHTQTWTPAMEAEFAARRGYALRLWLPTVAGWVVENPFTSERFLRDWRATISDLLVANYYGRLAALGRERGMRLSFETGPGDVAVGDILQYFGQADIPMCEFWQPNDPHWGGLETKPILPAVSAAHIYGKKRVAAEAFTNTKLRWDEYPFMLKHLADLHFSMGLNHLVFHTYTHNPRLNVVPGTSFGGGIGEPFLRGQTWWPYMPHFTDYISRCSYLLEQGQPVADVLWYLGDAVDHKPRQDEAFPKGYKFDYLNADALLNRITVTNGLLKTPEGARWKILWLPKNPRLTVATLTRLRDLVKQGATVVGLPSWQNPTLSGGKNADKQFAALMSDLWGQAPAARGDRRFGAGRLLWGRELDVTLAQLGIMPDVTGAGAATWCHRQADGLDIYFIAADRQAPLHANFSFRAQGQPECWDPLTGASKPVAVYQRQGDRTIVPLDLSAAGSVFVIFRPGKAEPVFIGVKHNGISVMDATDPSRVDQGEPQAVQGLKQGVEVQPWVENPFAACEILDGGRQLLVWESGDYQLIRADQSVAKVTASQPRAIPVTGPWSLSFPAGWGAPEQLDLPLLKPWSELGDPETRAFSGSATYTCTMNLESAAPDTRLVLDLGRVAVMAEVSVNGTSVGRLWTAPFRADITPFVTAGSNNIAVKVTSTWFNRLAYDAALPEAQRKTWTINAPAANSPLQPAGLIGPVVLRQGQVVKVP